jgi:hypothetical protein
MKVLGSVRLQPVAVLLFWSVPHDSVSTARQCPCRLTASVPCDYYVFTALNHAPRSVVVLVMCSERS